MARTNRDVEEFLNEGEYDECSLHDQLTAMYIEIEDLPDMCNQLVTERVE